MPEPTGPSRSRRALRLLLAVLMVLIGISHFTATDQFTMIVPAWLPAPRLLVLVSGVCEIAGGLGLLAPWPALRRLTGWGLVLLYIAVFPANINMAVNQIQPYAKHIPVALLWARLPFQALFITWAWWVTREPAPRPALA